MYETCRYWATAFALAFLLFVAPQAQGQVETDLPETEKLAQTGFKFLSVSPDARAAAMANTLTAVPHGSSVSMFYNPASMAHLDQFMDVSVAQTQWIADVDYNTASVALRPAGGLYGVFGLSLVAVDYGQYRATVRVDNSVDPKGYLDYSDIGLSNPTPTALAVGLGYARKLTDRFSVGGHARYALRNLGKSVLSKGSSGYSTENYSMNTFVFDFGVLYNTGFRSLNLAMSARNFSQELTYVSENFELPLTFRLGLSMDMMDLVPVNSQMHSFLLSVEAERPRDFAEQLKIGGEYEFMNMFSLRAGYLFPTDERGINLGVGFHPEFGDVKFGADYAYTPFGIFGNVNRLGLQLGF